MSDLRKSVFSNTNLKKLAVPNSGPASALNSGASTPTRNMEKTDSVVNLTRSSLYGIYQDDSMLNLSRDENDSVDEEALVARTLENQHNRRPPVSSPPSSAGSYAVAPPQHFEVPIVAKLFILSGAALIYNEVTKHINYNQFGGNKLANFPLTITNAFIFNLFDKLRLSHYFDGIGKTQASDAIDQLLALSLQGLIMSLIHPILDMTLPAKFSVRLLTSNPNPNNPKNLFTDILRASVIFLGIGYAIRKIEWSSFLQVSIVWSLLNPGMWILLDGTASGFLASLLASTIACAGIYAENASFSNQYLRFQSDEDWYALWLWIGSFFFCGVTIFGKIGRALFTTDSTTVAGR